MRLLAGLFAVVAWVAIATSLAIFLLSYSLVDGRIGVEVLQWTIWPYVIFVSVGVAGISLIATGPSVVSHLVRLKASLDNVPEHLANFQDLQRGASEMADQMKVVLEQVQKATDAAKKAAADAAVAAEKTDEASSQIADAGVDDDKRALVDQLIAHYQTAKAMYWEAAAAYKLKTGQDVERTQGYLNSDAIKDFEVAGVIAEPLARFVTRALQVEAGTRRTRRRDLTQASVTELDSLRDQAGV